MEPYHLAIPLAPLLFFQGRRARKNIPKLPEPSCPRTGYRGSGGPPLRLLIAGDSAAAGVGAVSQEQALAGQLGNLLARHYRLYWQLEARSGYTSADTYDHLGQLPSEPFDIVVTSFGVNDVVQGVTHKAWQAQLNAMIRRIETRFHCRRIIISGIPPIARFPALPGTTSLVSGETGRHVRNQSQEEPGGLSFLRLSPPQPRPGPGRHGC